MSGLIDSFGSAVRHLREAQGWSQELLAEKADLNRSYLGEVERGSAMPSLATVVKLALALELPAGDLLDGCERMDELPAPVQHTIA